ncbi:DNA-binding CsgD family transcriptional regulator [Paenibacillus forsythiae]|uniref:DNA-binding CsgD family transcriptional regulator n=1 Tax=Paenibacillus forsythiae TaxID=365616 RepID=A0ABU3H5V4_9BACL|nr:LuxR family transcriptional regulator [Paenibacillus forsythiae]MDT3426205.1 DNA-binding CsgD family transcriptional regulator [Paenibacillus forsythiae]
MTVELSSLEERELEFIVGRSAEAAAFTRMLQENCEHACMILHVYGTGGIGKSTYLRLCRRWAKQQDAIFVLIDSSDFIHTEQGLVEAVFKQLPPVPATGQPASCNLNGLMDSLHFLTLERRLVLSFDTFEEMPEMESWLRDILFPRLPKRTLLLFSGRYPLKGRWIVSPALRERICQMELDYLNLPDRMEYLQKCGLDNPELMEKLSYSTRGHPLSLSLAAAAYSPSSPAFGNDYFDEVIELWLREVPDHELRKLLDAASLLHIFHHELLAFIMDEEVSSKAFNRLIALSFVRRSQRGWQLHDLLREFIRLRLQKRTPGLYKRLKQRAAQYYADALLSAPYTEREWEAGELFRYTGIKVARALMSEQEQRSYYWETATQSTLADAVAFANWRENHIKPISGVSVDPETGTSYSIEYTAEEIRLQLKPIDLSEVFALDPSSIKLLRNEHGQAKALFVVIPIHSNTLEWLESDPLCSPYLNALTREEKDKLGTPPERPAGWFMRCTYYSDLLDPAVRTAGIYLIYSYMFRGGVFVSSPFVNEISRRAYMGFGFHEVEGATHYYYDGITPTPTYAVDTQGAKLQDFLERLFSRTGLEWQEKRQEKPGVPDGPVKAGVPESSLDGDQLLTKREKEVAKLVLDGFSNSQVAKSLYISEITVKKHLNSIYSKLGITKRIQLAQKYR